MAGIVEGAKNGSLTFGMTETIVDAPSGATTKKIVKLINIHNKHTSNITVVIKYVGSSTSIMYNVTIAPNDTFIVNDLIVLDATTKTITADLTTSPGTLADYVTSHIEHTPC